MNPNQQVVMELSIDNWVPSDVILFVYILLRATGIFDVFFSPQTDFPFDYFDSQMSPKPPLGLYKKIAQKTKCLRFSLHLFKWQQDK